MKPHVLLVLTLALPACDREEKPDPAPAAASPEAPPTADDSKEPGEHHPGHEGGHHAEHGEHGPGHHGGEDSPPGAEHQAHRHMGGHHRFEDAEKWAKTFDDPARDEWQKPDAVLSFLKLAPDAVVVDIGAGTGYFAVRLAAAVPRGKVLANDIEPDMVSYLGERAEKDGVKNLTPVKGTAEATGLKDGEKADVAFMCDVYHHIADPEAYFADVRAHLNEGGRLVIVDFDPEAPEDAPGPPRAMRVSADAIAKRLAAVGFRETRRDTETLTYQYILELTPTLE